MQQISPDTELVQLDIDARYLNPLAVNGLLTISDLLDVVKDKRGALLKLDGIGQRTSDVVLDEIEQVGFEVPAPEDQAQYVSDDDQLADIVIDEIGSNYRFFRSAWHVYESGLWQAVKNINREIIRVLRVNRPNGVRPSRSKCSSVEFFVQTALELEDDSIVDDYPQYFSVRNGLFNLDAMQLELHRKDAYITAQASFDFDPRANAPTFRSWLAQMLVKPNSTDTDWDLVNLVQEMMGYCLTGDTYYRVSFWIVGGSATGKSTLIILMRILMESYHTTVNLNQLATNRFLLARIAGKRLVTSVEASAGVRLDDGIYKSLVSDDEIEADVKNRDPITFVPQCKIVWAMNNLPYVSDRSGAVDSRVIIIPMMRQIPRDEWDVTLDEKLKAELPGIFNFALEGLQRLRQQDGFTKVAQSQEMSDKYRRMQDIYAAFLEDERWCILDDGRTNPTQLFKAFSAWCSEAGIRNYASKISISREWERLGLKSGNSGGRYYAGISLTHFAQNQIHWK